VLSFKSYVPKIAQEMKLYKKPPEILPEPGTYDPHKKKFGEDVPSFTIHPPKSP